MDFKGTKGNWESADQTGVPGHCHTAQVFINGNNAAIIEATENEEEASANARLMASAPALLQSLQKIMEMVEHYDDGYTQFGLTPTFKKAERAIKKALAEK